MDSEWNVLKCPCCGGTERFFEQLTAEAKPNIRTRPDWNMRFQVTSGAAVDPVTVQQLPAGADVIGFEVQTDICVHEVTDEVGSKHICGNVYAVKIKRFPAKVQKQAATPHIVLPAHSIKRMPPFSGVRAN